MIDVKSFLPELYMGLSSLMVHKLRSLLTMMGMIFGVGAVVSMTLPPMVNFLPCAAPMVVKDKVLIGISGGEFGVQCHVTAYDLTPDGARVAFLEHVTSGGYSVDLGLANLRTIRARHPDATVVVADSSRLPFRSGTFDCTVCSEVLEHVNDPAGVVDQLARALRVGGTAVLTTPYREKIRTYLCIHCNRPTPANAHIHSFDEARHRALLERADLRPDVLHPMQNKLLVASRLSHLLRWAPYRFWRLVDALCMFVFRRANSILVRATKP